MLDLDQYKTPRSDKSASFLTRSERSLKQDLNKISKQEKMSFNELVLRILRAAVVKYWK